VLKSKGISKSEVLNAIAEIPRHLFIPPEFDSHAYEDKAFPIGEGQTISQPYTVAFQTELLGEVRGKKILEIGTGSGYQAAVLVHCGAELYSIERHAKLSQSAAKILQELNLNKLRLFTGDGTKGLPDYMPFDGIIVTAGAPSVPKALLSQLKVGGFLIIPVGKDQGVQKMLRITRVEEDPGYKTEMFENFSFVPLVGEYAWKA